MTGKDLVKQLLNEGWKTDRIKGSHHIMEKDGKIVKVKKRVAKTTGEVID